MRVVGKYPQNSVSAIPAWGIPVVAARFSQTTAMLVGRTAGGVVLDGTYCFRVRDESIERPLECFAGGIARFAEARRNADQGLAGS